MTLTLGEIGLYAGALLILFLTPGPVWVALIARGVTGGFHAAWPLAVGVGVGDVLWPLAAMLGLAWVVSANAGVMDAMRWVAAGVFVAMGIGLIRHAGRLLSGSEGRLTRPGLWAGFTAGLMAIVGNPKAILFYLGVLPGFFDLTRVTGWDIAAICVISAVVPLMGNLGLALSMDRVRRFLASPAAVRRTNIAAGALLIGVGGVIALS